MRKGIKLETPVTYRIRVQGRLNTKYSDELAGMTITKTSTEDDLWVTTLVGHLRDQAALSGVLNSLYEFRLPLLSVDILDE
jgi:hypothetical protein